jgi:hypothetical protein
VGHLPLSFSASRASFAVGDLSIVSPVNITICPVLVSGSQFLISELAQPRKNMEVKIKADIYFTSSPGFWCKSMDIGCRLKEKG